LINLVQRKDWPNSLNWITREIRVSITTTGIAYLSIGE